MKIFVCVKQVPDTETKIKILPDLSGIDSSGIKWVMNPYDEYAVEEAVKLRDAHPGSQVWVLSSGPKARVVESLRTALAMGADEAIVINSPDQNDHTSSSVKSHQIKRSCGKDRLQKDLSPRGCCMARRLYRRVGESGAGISRSNRCDDPVFGFC